MRVKTRALRTIVRVFATLVFFDLLLTFAYLLLSDYLVNKYAQFKPNQVALIFFEGYGDYQGVSEGSYKSVMFAKQIYDTKQVSNVICLGGARMDKQVRGAVLMCNILRNQGVPSEVLYLDSMSWDTITNLKEAKRIMHEKAWNSAALVSSKLHMIRILYLAAERGMEFRLAPYQQEFTFSWIYLKHLWWEVHHEFTAWLAMMVLSDENYYKMMKNYRLDGMEIEN